MRPAPVNYFLMLHVKLLEESVDEFLISASLLCINKYHQVELSGSIWGEVLNNLLLFLCA